MWRDVRLILRPYFPSISMKALAVTLLLAFAATASAQDITVTYDEFGPMADQDKIRVFNEVSPENRALLVRTQAERWLAANRDRLSEEQVEAVEGAIAFIRPELYDEANREAEQAEMQVVMQSVTAVLSDAEVMHAFTRRGAYIPPQE